MPRCRPLSHANGATPTRAATARCESVPQLGQMRDQRAGGLRARCPAPTVGDPLAPARPGCRGWPPRCRHRAWPVVARAAQCAPAAVCGRAGAPGPAGCVRPRASRSVAAAARSAPANPAWPRPPAARTSGWTRAPNSASRCASSGSLLACCPRRARKVAHLARVDHHHGQSRAAQLTRQQRLIAPGRFHARSAAAPGAEARHEGTHVRLGLRRRPLRRRRATSRRPTTPWPRRCLRSDPCDLLRRCPRPALRMRDRVPGNGTGSHSAPRRSAQTQVRSRRPKVMRATVARSSKIQRSTLTCDASSRSVSNRRR